MYSGVQKCTPEYIPTAGVELTPSAHDTTITAPSRAPSVAVPPCGHPGSCDHITWEQYTLRRSASRLPAPHHHLAIATSARRAPSERRRAGFRRTSLVALLLF